MVEADRSARTETRTADGSGRSGERSVSGMPCLRRGALRGRAFAAAAASGTGRSARRWLRPARRIRTQVAYHFQQAGDRASGRVADPRWRAGAACLCLVHRRRALGRGPSQLMTEQQAPVLGRVAVVDTHSAGHALCRSAPSRRPIGGGREAGDRDCGSWSGDPHFLPRRPLSYHYGRHPRGNAAGHPLC